MLYITGNYISLGFKWAQNKLFSSIRGRKTAIFFNLCCEKTMPFLSNFEFLV